jgi:hypothetical protein
VPAKSDPHMQEMVRLFVRAYDGGRWNGDVAWPDEKEDGRVDALITAVDRRRLAIEHTLIEPFEGNQEAIVRLREWFLPLQSDPELMVAGVASYVEVAREAFERGVSARHAADCLRLWLRKNLVSRPVDGTRARFDCDCSRARSFAVTVRRQKLSTDAGVLLIQRFGNTELPRVVERALERKLDKLVAESAERRVLLLERESWAIDPRDIISEVERQRHRFSALDRIDQVWVVETAFSEPSVSSVPDWFDFQRFGADRSLAESYWFLKGKWIEHSRDGENIPIES